jgi:hypothetical protein
MERFVEVTPQVRLWVEDVGRGEASALILIMGRASMGGMLFRCSCSTIPTDCYPRRC